MSNKNYEPILEVMPVRRKENAVVMEPLIGYELDGVPHLWTLDTFEDYDKLNTLTDEEQEGLANAWPNLFRLVEDES